MTSTPSPEARPDLEERAREKAHALLAHGVARWCSSNVNHCSACNAVTAELLKLAREREALTVERDEALAQVARQVRDFQRDMQALQRDLEARRQPGEVERRLTEALAEASARCEALQRERDEWRTLADRCEDVATLRAERDTARADLAAARAERGELRQRLLDTTPTASQEVWRAEANKQSTRAESAERDLAALRRRVGEAASVPESNHIKILRYWSQRDTNQLEAMLKELFERYDHARAAAGELRAALERIRDNPCLSVGGGECRPDCNHADHVAARVLKATETP